MAAGSAGTATTHAPRPTATARMKAGDQTSSANPWLRRLAAFGVSHVCSSLPSLTLDEHWSVEGLSRLRERVESLGIQLAMVPLPLSSSGIRRAERPNILRGKSPERDREIDQICEMIQNTSKAGIPAVRYNLNILGVPRTADSRGRGGARHSTFVCEKAEQDALTAAGTVSADEMWERITYFLTQETFPDDGDIDMIRAMRVYKTWH
jgi:mannonate dehydratase